MSNQQEIEYHCPKCDTITVVGPGTTVCRNCYAALPIVAEDDSPSEEAVAYFQDCRDLLGIGADWHLWLRATDQLGDDDDADGLCEMEERYLKATITIRRGLSDSRMRAVIMHELLHVALAPISLAVERIRDFIPAKASIHAILLYKDAEEQTIERLTRALQRTVKPKTTE